MQDQLADAARVVEPKRRKVRTLAVALQVGNSVVELGAGRYVKAVNRIWGAKVASISAPLMRDATFGTRVSPQGTPASDGKRRQPQHVCTTASHTYRVRS